MKLKTALHILNLNEAESVASARQKFLARKAELEELLRNAATDGLRQKYSKDINTLEQAYEVVELQGNGIITQNSRRTLKFAVPIAALLLTVAAYFAIKSRGSEERNILELVRQGKMVDALVRAKTLSQNNPGDAKKLLIYENIAGDFTRRLGQKYTTLAPLKRLEQQAKDLLEVGSLLRTSDIAELKEHFSYAEQSIIEELENLIRDGTLDDIKLITSTRVLDLLFSSGAADKVKAIREIAATLDVANKSIKDGNYAVSAGALNKVPERLRGNLFKSIYARLTTKLEDINAELLDVKNLLLKEDYTVAVSKIRELRSSESWVVGLREGIRIVQAQAASRLRSLIVDSIEKNDVERGVAAFKNLCVLRGHDAKVINIENADALIKEIRDLSKGIDLNKKIDSIAILSAITKAKQAHREFFRDEYMFWADQESRSGNYESACYLGLLAKANGAENVDQKIVSWSEQLQNSFNINVSYSQGKAPHPKAKDLVDEFDFRISKAIPLVLPPWARINSRNSAPADLAINVAISDYSIKKERAPRLVTKTVAGQTFIRNPEYDRAIAELNSAQSALGGAAKSASTTSAVVGIGQQYYSQVGSNVPGLSLLSSVLGTTVQTLDQNSIIDAQNRVEQLRQRIAGIPQEVPVSGEKLVTWKEADYITKFYCTATIRLKSLTGEVERAFSVNIIHKSTERKANADLSIEELDRELPDLDEINEQLQAALMAQLGQYFEGLWFTDIKGVLAKLIENRYAELEPTRISLKKTFLWWGMPPFNLNGLSAGELTEAFGQVVPVQNGAGGLYVESRPVSAEVVIDGIVAGVTPLFLRNVESGKREVEIRSTGYTMERRSVTVPAGEYEAMKVELKRSRGAVSISSRSGGSSYTLTGLDSSQIQFSGAVPVGRLEVPTGDYVLSVRCEGFPEFKQSVSIADGKLETIEVDFENRKSVIYINSPLIAVVKLNDIDRGKTPLRLDDLKPGVYTVHIIADGKAPFQKSVELKPGETLEVNATFEELPELSFYRRLSSKKWIRHHIFDVFFHLTFLPDNKYEWWLEDRSGFDTKKIFTMQTVDARNNTFTVKYPGNLFYKGGEAKYVLLSDDVLEETIPSGKKFIYKPE